MLDTSVLVAAVRSPDGASKALLDLVLDGQIEILISNPLMLEYEAVITRPEHLKVSEYSLEEVEKLLDAICNMGTETSLRWSWRPQLSDPDDEMVLETAINGRADAIVTFNRADFARAAKSFGLAVLLPVQALHKAGQR